MIHIMHQHSDDDHGILKLQTKNALIYIQYLLYTVHSLYLWLKHIATTSLTD